MAGYLARRIVGALLVMWAVATLVFFMMRAVPGDPLAAMMFDSGDPAAAEDLRKALGMDIPVYEQ
jgi:peptide/nickel transport system permease protein